MMLFLSPNLPTQYDREECFVTNEERRDEELGNKRPFEWEQFSPIIAGTLRILNYLLEKYL